MPGLQSTVFAGIQETPVPSAAKTTTGNSGTLSDYGSAVNIRAQLNVTAASGTTPTLDVIIQDSVDNGSNWNTIGTFTQKNAVSREVININPAKAESGTFQPMFGNLLRVQWTIGGTTPSFTFQVDWVVSGPGG